VSPSKIFLREFEVAGPENLSVAGARAREQAIAKAQEVWVGTTTSAAAFVKMLEVLGVTVEGIDGGKLRRDLGRCRSGPSPTRGVGTPDFGEDGRPSIRSRRDRGREAPSKSSSPRSGVPTHSVGRDPKSPQRDRGGLAVARRRHRGERVGSGLEIVLTRSGGADPPRREGPSNRPQRNRGCRPPLSERGGRAHRSRQTPAARGRLGPTHMMLWRLRLR
jgi:hypothetical protein